MIEPPSVDDLALLDAFRNAGDREALLHLFQRHSNAAYRLALRLSGNHADAEDAVQNGFIALIAATRNYRGTGSVRSWMLSIVANTYLHHARTNMRRVHHERIASSLPPATPAVDPQMRTTVLTCLAELPDRYRLPVAMRYLDDLGFDDISAALGCKEKTIRSHVSRGLHLLRSLLVKRGIAVSVLCLTGLLVEAPAATPPGVQDSLRRIAESSTPPPPTTAPLLGWGIAALSLVGLAMAALVLIHDCPVLSPPPAVSPVVAPPTPLATDRVSATLSQVQRIGFRQWPLRLVVFQCLDRLPQTNRIPIAVQQDVPETRIEIGFGDHQLREILQTAASQAGLKITGNRFGVVLHHHLSEDELTTLITAFDRADAGHRPQAAQALVDSQDPAAIRPLLLALSGDPAAAAVAGQALLRLKASSHDAAHLPESMLLALADDVACRTSVLTALRRPDHSVEARQAAIRAAGHLRLAEAADAILPLAQAFVCDGRSDVRRSASIAPGVGKEAIEALGFLAGSGPALAALLAPENGAVNNELVQALGRLRDPATIQPLLELNRQLLTAGNPRLISTTNNLLLTLGRIGNDAAVEPLIRIASGPDKVIRPSVDPKFSDRPGEFQGVTGWVGPINSQDAATVALGIMASPTAIEGLIRVAKTDGPPTWPRGRDTDFFTAYGFRLARHPGVMREHQATLANIADPHLRYAISLSLLDDTDPELLPLIQEALPHLRDPNAYQASVTRLAVMSQPRAREFLLASVPDRQAQKQLWPLHVRAIATESSPEATSWLIDHLHPDRPLAERRFAFACLIFFNRDPDPFIPERLRSIIAKEMDANLRHEMDVWVAMPRPLYPVDPFTF